MAKGGTSGKAGSATGPAAGTAASSRDDNARRAFGVRSLASLLPPIVRPAFKTRAPAATLLMSDWLAVAGPHFGLLATPRRFSGGTLTLAASGPAALELQHLSVELIARLNGALGRSTVERLRFVQDENAAAPATPTSRPVPAPEPVAVPGLQGPLADALARLGGRVRSRARS